MKNQTYHWVDEETGEVIEITVTEKDINKINQHNE